MSSWGEAAESYGGHHKGYLASEPAHKENTKPVGPSQAGMLWWPLLYLGGLRVGTKDYVWGNLPREVVFVQI